MLRWAFRLLAFVAIVWLAATVPLGKRTLFGHLTAIARTPEARDLAEGTKEQAGRLAEKVREDLAVDGGTGKGGALRKRGGR